MSLLVTVPAGFVDLPGDARERISQDVVYADLRLFHKLLGYVHPVYGVVDVGRLRVTGRFEYGLIALELGFPRVEAIVREPIPKDSLDLLTEAGATIVPVPKLTAEETWGALVKDGLHLIGFAGDASAAIPLLSQEVKPLFLESAIDSAHDFEIHVARDDRAVAYFSAATPVGQSVRAFPISLLAALRRVAEHHPIRSYRGRRLPQLGDPSHRSELFEV